MIGLVITVAAVALTPADRVAIFKSADTTRRGTGWTICADDPRATAKMAEVGDLNGDGRPEAVVSEDSLQCYGGDETAFNLVSKQSDGRWKSVFSTSGVPEFLKTKGVGGWPDIAIGGQGFCFPVVRWNGREYANHRRQYRGKPCR